MEILYYADKFKHVYHRDCGLTHIWEENWKRKGWKLTAMEVIRLIIVEKNLHYCS